MLGAKKIFRSTRSPEIGLASGPHHIRAFRRQQQKGDELSFSHQSDVSIQKVSFPLSSRLVFDGRAHIV
jgi:hypothetical protein